MNNELGNLLKKLRGYNSLRTISEKTNGKISYGYLNILEKGNNPSTGQAAKPNPEILKILSEVYNYSYEELLKISGYLKTDKNKVNKVFNEFKELSEEEKIELIKLIKTTK